ncbi:CHAT domain-containing protein [Nocardiopsis valliformis]|uniref:CHAT domain-containing protein n=1 Tax=Nocardiopsis valliformis TaxID=239974 RepID=UPI00034AF115|nr:CHAT domain-containing protein [Nocardiopsis valliformis]
MSERETSGQSPDEHGPDEQETPDLDSEEAAALAERVERLHTLLHDGSFLAEEGTNEYLLRSEMADACDELSVFHGALGEEDTALAFLDRALEHNVWLIDALTSVVGTRWDGEEVRGELRARCGVSTEGHLLRYHLLLPSEPEQADLSLNRAVADGVRLRELLRDPARPEELLAEAAVLYQDLGESLLDRVWTGRSTNGVADEEEALVWLRLGQRVATATTGSVSPEGRALLIRALCSRYWALRNEDRDEEAGALSEEALGHSAWAVRAVRDDALDDHRLPGIIAELHEERSCGRPGADNDAAVDALILQRSLTETDVVTRALTLLRLGSCLDLRIPPVEVGPQSLTPAQRTDLATAISCYEDLLALFDRYPEEFPPDHGERIEVLLHLVEWYWIENKDLLRSERLDRMVGHAEELLDRPVRDLRPEVGEMIRLRYAIGTALWVDQPAVLIEGTAIPRIERALGILRAVEATAVAGEEAGARAEENGSGLTGSHGDDVVNFGTMIAQCLVTLVQTENRTTPRTAGYVHEAVARLTALLERPMTVEQETDVRGVLSTAVFVGIQSNVLGEEWMDRVLPLLDEEPTGPPDSTGDRLPILMRGLMRIQRAAAARDDDDLDRGIKDLRVAATVPDPGSRAMALNGLGSAVLTRYFQRGDLADAQAAADALRSLLGFLETNPTARADIVDKSVPTIRVQYYLAQALVHQARTGRWPAMDSGDAAEIRQALEAMDKDSPDRLRLMSEFGLALALAELHARTLTADSEGLAMLRRAALEWPRTGQNTHRDLARLRAASLMVTVHHISGDQEPETLDEARQWLAELAENADTAVAARASGLLGLATQTLYERDRDPMNLTRAIQSMEKSREQFPLSHPTAHQQRRSLARMYWKRAGSWGRDDRERARAAGAESLRAAAYQVFLQPTVSQALERAREAAGFAAVLAHWHTVDGEVRGAVEALELGRGLILHATTSVLSLAELLESAGKDALAYRWREYSRSRAGGTGDHAPEVPDLGEPEPGGLSDTGLRDLLADAGMVPTARVPDDLRHRVLRALEDSPRLRLLLRTPTTGEIAESLRRTGQDALVYLVPAPAGQGPPIGVAVVVSASGALRYEPLGGLTDLEDGSAHRLLRAQQRVARASPALRGQATENFNRELPGVLRWAGRTALAPLLASEAFAWLDRPPRLVLVPTGRLGAIPWPAVTLPGRPGGPDQIRPHPALSRAVISTASTARQFVTVAGRAPADVTSRPVLVLDPTGTLPGASAEVSALRRILHPNAELLGPGGDAPGTPREVLDRLPSERGPGGSLLHFSTHMLAMGSPERSFVSLAGERLSLARVLDQALGLPEGEPGALVVMMACLADVSLDHYDEALTLATGFLAAGAATTVGSRWSVPDRLAAMLSFQFHRNLVVEGMRPADALRAAQAWMAAPVRVFPDDMPPELRQDPGPDDLRCWAAFGHQGW